MSLVDTNNSSNNNIDICGQFQGTRTDVSIYNGVIITVYSDVPGIIYAQISADGITNWISKTSYTLSAATSLSYTINVVSKYYRIMYENGSNATTNFRLQTILSMFPPSSDSVRIGSELTSEHQGQNTNSVIYGSTNTSKYIPINVTGEGHLEVAIHGPILPFGSLHTESLRPILQSDAVYGINPSQNISRTDASGLGIVDVSSNCYRCSSGTGTSSYGWLESRKRLRYRAGQGLIGRSSGVFPTPSDASGNQLIGFGHAEDGVYIGYVGTTFGILKSSFGKRAVYKLTITTGATSANSVIITLGNTGVTVATSVPVTASSNTLRTAYEIFNYVNGYKGWTTDLCGTSVYFISDYATPYTIGTFGVDSTGAVGTMSLTQTGVVTSDVFIPQTDWNGDKMDGTGTSGITLIPEYGNVYEFDIQYLGFGAITIAIEVTYSDSNNSDMLIVHTIRIPNSQTLTSLSNPSLPFRLLAQSLGSTTPRYVLAGSYAGFIEGQRILHGNRFTYKSVVTTTATSVVFIPLFTVLASRYFNGRTSQVIINIISLTYSAYTATTGQIANTLIEIQLVRGAVLTGNPNFTIYDSTLSATMLDTASTGVGTIANSQIIWSGLLAPNTASTFTFTDDITVQPGEMISVLGRVTSTTGIATIGVSLNTREDQ